MTAMANRDFHLSAAKQSGVVLITGLIFLVIMTLIVLAVLRTGTLEERMAANARNRQLALQASEAVLRDAEVSLFTTPTAPVDPFSAAGYTDACTNGFCSKPVIGDRPKWKTIKDWSSTSAVTRTFASTASNLTSTLVASQPRYIVEVMTTPVISPSAGGGICPTIIYRLTGRGVGQDSSEVLVQTVYRSLPEYC